MRDQEEMANDSFDLNKNGDSVSANKVIDSESSPAKTHNDSKKAQNCCLRNVLHSLPTASELRQYAGVLICGFSMWGSLWFVFHDLVIPGGFVFNMTAVAVSGYVLGHTLERYTTIHPVVGMTLAGVLFRNLASWNHLDDSLANNIDFHLRRVYPVIILTRGPLSWNWEYIKKNSVKVFSLATIPWIIECLSTALLTHILLGFPWYWGVHLGAILASVSPAIVVPTCMAFNARGLGAKNQIALLVGNAGGLDTAFTEGMFGVINSAIFYQSPPAYRIVKALLAIFIGIGLGILWGILADLIPDHSDIYAPTIRSLLLFSGGLLISYVAAYFGWGGTGGVAIMVCAATASTRWSHRGWVINNNPVSEVFKLLWRILEPMLFSLSGYFLEVSQISLQDFGLIVACIFSALILRLLTAFLVAIGNELSVKESLFVAITWIPKAIVEAVLVRVATDSLWADGTTSQDVWIAKQHSNIIVIAILLTTTLGSVLTTVLGPILLSNESKVAPQEFYRKQSLSPPHPAGLIKENKTRKVSFQFIDA